MRKIVDYRKVLGVDKNAELQELKTVYRTLMKNWHPDKFTESAESKLEAEEKSKSIIEAYHFLVSIAPETIENLLPEFKETITSSIISDYQYTQGILEVFFLNGSSYEFHNVPKNTYTKLVNADSPSRFAKRHIYNEFIFRKATNTNMEMA